eukprot:639703_1
MEVVKPKKKRRHKRLKQHTEQSLPKSHIIINEEPERSNLEQVDESIRDSDSNHVPLATEEKEPSSNVSLGDPQLIPEDLSKSKENDVIRTSEKSDKDETAENILVPIDVHPTAVSEGFEVSEGAIEKVSEDPDAAVVSEESRDSLDATESVPVELSERSKFEGLIADIVSQDPDAVVDEPPAEAVYIPEPVQLGEPIYSTLDLAHTTDDVNQLAEGHLDLVNERNEAKLPKVIAQDEILTRSLPKFPNPETNVQRRNWVRQ